MVNDTIETHLREYDALRKEILARLQMQHQVILFCVMVTGAVISSFLFLAQHGESRPLLLLVSFVYFIFAWHYFEQDFLIAHVASYIHNSLRGRIDQAIAAADGETALRWETFRNEIVFQSRLGNLFYSALTLFRLVPTVGCGLLVLSAYVHSTFFRAPPPKDVARWEFAVLGVDIVLALVMCVVAFAAFRAYKDIAPDDRALRSE